CNTCSLLILDTILLRRIGYSEGPVLSLGLAKLGGMRDLSHDAPLLLFDAPPPVTYAQAKEFVRWCCSFGPAFRNSPDVTNLRYWAHKNKIKIIEREEKEIIDAARHLFLKRVEQAIRKSERNKAQVC